MNPKEFGWSAEQQVTVTNPTAKDFDFRVHGKEYVVKAGATVKMPGFMAWMYVYNIATQAAQLEGQFLHWNEEGFRKTYFDKFVLGAEEILQQVEEQPAIESFDSPEVEEDEEDEPDLPLAPEAHAQEVAPMRKQNGRRRKA